MTRTVLKCGYLPLVDAAPLLIAKELGFAAEEGLDLCLFQQPSWSALRDLLALGHLDAAHMLSPMPVAMRLGLGGLRSEIDVLSVLSVNGTVFGVSNALGESLEDASFGDAQGLLDRIAHLGPARLRVGVPFHAAMHRLLLSYWMRAAPQIEFEVITVPPPRMTDALENGQIDAFWVGEPWGSVAVRRGVGRLMMTGRDVWAFAPEKVLAARTDWVKQNPVDTRRLMRAIHNASRWLDRRSNKSLAVEILARSEHLDLTPDLIDPAITGFLLADSQRPPVQVDQFLLFHKHAANFPWRSQAAWIAAQLGADASGITLAKQCFRPDLYRDNLGPIGADLPGASEKIEGAMIHETAVASSRGHMILGPDAFFDGKTYDFAGNGC